MGKMFNFENIHNYKRGGGGGKRQIHRVTSENVRKKIGNRRARE